MANNNVGRRRSIEGEDLGDYTMRQDNTAVVDRKEKMQMPSDVISKIKRRLDAKRQHLIDNYDLTTGNHKTDPNAEPVRVFQEKERSGRDFGKYHKKVSFEGEVFDFGRVEEN